MKSIFSRQKEEDAGRQAGTEIEGLKRELATPRAKSDAAGGGGAGSSFPFVDRVFSHRRSGNSSTVAGGEGVRLHHQDLPRRSIIKAPPHLLLFKPFYRPRILGEKIVSAKGSLIEKLILKIKRFESNAAGFRCQI